MRRNNLVVVGLGFAIAALVSAAVGPGAAQSPSAALTGVVGPQADPLRPSARSGRPEPAEERGTRVVRLNTGTGEMVEYLLPNTTNIRRVNVDNSTTRPTFWVGDNLGASLVRVEPLD